MDLRQMIEKAVSLRAEQRLIAKEIGVAPNSLTDAKAGRRGLPVSACIKLAEILDMDPMTVIAASELVTEKSEDKRAVFAPFVHLPRKAAALALGIATGAILGTTAPTDAYANDTFKVSSPAPQPAPLQGFAIHAIGIMSIYIDTARPTSVRI